MFITDRKIKKAAALMTAVSMLTAFTACGDDKKKESNDTSSAESASVIPFEDDTASVVEFNDSEDTDAATTTTTTQTTTTTAATPKRDNSYKVSAKKYSSDDGNINISYPQISGLYDENMQAYYNKLFKSDFENYVNDKDLEKVTCEYEVTLKNEDLLSMVFRCNVYMPGAAHTTSYAYAYTIDLETGETLVPSAAVDLDKASKSLLSDKGWNLTRSIDGVSKSDVIEYYNQFDASEIKEFITEADVVTVKRNAKGKYSTSGSISCRSYLDSSSDPILILDVSHAVGDYVEVEFN